MLLGTWLTYFPIAITLDVQYNEFATTDAQFRFNKSNFINCTVWKSALFMNKIIIPHFILMKVIQLVFVSLFGFSSFFTLWLVVFFSISRSGICYIGGQCSGHSGSGRWLRRDNAAAAKRFPGKKVLRKKGQC